MGLHKDNVRPPSIQLGEVQDIENNGALETYALIVFLSFSIILITTIIIFHKRVYVLVL